LFAQGVIEKKSQTRYGIPWNPEYDATNNCTNPHMSFSHSSVLVEEMEMKKCETKKLKKSIIIGSFSQKMER
jgi:hypothetical protein